MSDDRLDPAVLRSALPCEGDLPTEHLNRCQLRDNLLYADLFNDDGSHWAVWRCHKRAGHDGPCSSHNDCGVMNGGVVCGKPPGHAGPHEWATEIRLPEPPRKHIATLVSEQRRALAALRYALDALRGKVARFRGLVDELHSVGGMDYMARNTLIRELNALLTALPLPQPDFWRCTACGCLWRDNHDETVSLASQKQTSCPSCELIATATACEPLVRMNRIP